MPAPVFVSGEPAVYWGSGEASWKDKVKQVATDSYLHPRLQFLVGSYLKGGHRFDLDNLAKPVLDLVTAEAETVWVAMTKSQTPGVFIQEEEPGRLTLIDRAYYLEAPPKKSVKLVVSLPELAGAILLGFAEPVSIQLIFDDPQTRIWDFSMEGPIKCVIDALWPVLGGAPNQGHDHRMRELRIFRGADPGKNGVRVALKILPED